jgi:ribosomal protein S18 acetylase RimI-like enzyme
MGANCHNPNGVISHQNPEAIRLVANSPSSLRVEVLTENEWSRLKSIRLTALQDDPAAFLSNHEDEVAFDEQKWREEFSRGQWNVMVVDHQEIGLLGVTRETTMPKQECYLEYLWVASEFRRVGFGSFLLRAVIDHLRDSGIHTVWLYILDGNDLALRLYTRFGFQNANGRQLLPYHQAGGEELMKLQLDLVDSFAAGISRLGGPSRRGGDAAGRRSCGSQ